MSMPPEETSNARHLTHDDVVRIVGDLDDSVIAAILGTGASYAEIEQALKWVGAGVDGPRRDALNLSPLAELVCDILAETAEFSEEEPIIKG